MSSAPVHEVTQLLEDLAEGEDHAADRLIPVVYDELRRLAGSYMANERPDHTLQPTALVHEAYFRLVGQRDVRWRNRAHFFAVAATAMRRLLIDHARRHRAEKRGGGRRVTLSHELADDGGTEILDVLALEEVLARLEELDRRQAKVVELRFFGALEVEEVAEVLGVSPATVKRDWRHARAWIRRELRGRGAGEGE